MEDDTRACLRCNASIAAGSHWKRRYCSDDCSKRHWVEMRVAPIPPESKQCSMCRVVLPIEKFSPARQCRDGYRNECRACRSALEKSRWGNTSHRRSRSPEYKRRQRYKRKYGITPEDYDRMFAEQAGVCAICGRTPEENWKRRDSGLVIDHDHRARTALPLLQLATWSCTGQPSGVARCDCLPLSIGGPMTVTPVPGDVFCVRTNSIAARVIRLGASLRYLFSGGNNFRDLDNHIVIVSHQTDGVFWGIEGKPGGVGYADLTAYLNDRATVTNFDQPKTDEQRAQLLACIPQVLKAPYDWPAIMVSAALALHIPTLFKQNWRGQGIPGHVICSSLASWMYTHVGLAAPTQGRYTEPSDWTTFCLVEGWRS